MAAATGFSAGTSAGGTLLAGEVAGAVVVGAGDLGGLAATPPSSSSQLTTFLGGAVNSADGWLRGAPCGDRGAGFAGGA